MAPADATSARRGHGPGSGTPTRSPAACLRVEPHAVAACLWAVGDNSRRAPRHARQLAARGGRSSVASAGGPSRS